MRKFINAFGKMSKDLRTWYELKPFPRTENDRFINNQLIDLIGDDSYREEEHDIDGNIIKISHKQYCSFEAIFMGVDLLKAEYPSIDFSEIYVILKKYQKYFDKEFSCAKEESLLNEIELIRKLLTSTIYHINKTNNKFDKLNDKCDKLSDMFETSFTRLVRLFSELSDTDKD